MLDDKTLKSFCAENGSQTSILIIERKVSASYAKLCSFECSFEHIKIIIHNLENSLLGKQALIKFMTNLKQDLGYFLLSTYVQNGIRTH